MYAIVAWPQTKSDEGVIGRLKAEARAVELTTLMAKRPSDLEVRRVQGPTGKWSLQYEKKRGKAKKEVEEAQKKFDESRPPRIGPRMLTSHEKKAKALRRYNPFDSERYTRGKKSYSEQSSLADVKRIRANGGQARVMRDDDQFVVAIPRDPGTGSGAKGRY